MSTRKIILPTVVSTSAPTSSDDANDGYLVGHLWLYGTTLYVCTTNTVGAAVWTSIAGGGGGGVSSVGLSLPSSIFDVSGSPVTGSGTLTATLDAQVKNKAFVGPITGSDAAPTFRILDKADLKAALAAALVDGSNMTITDNGDGTFTFDASGGGGGGGDIDWTSPVSVSAATTLTVSSMGKNHVCSGTSYTVDFNYTSLTAGMVVAFQMAASLTGLVTIDAGSGKAIDGLRYRMLWANETCVLKWDGSNWQKLYGKQIPMSCCLKRTSAQSITGFVWTAVACTTSVYDNTNGLTSPMGDTTNGRANILRPGKYMASGFSSLTGLTPAVETNGGVAKNSASPGDNPNAFTTVPVPSSGNVAFSGAAVFDCDTGDWIAPILFHGDSSPRNTRAVGTVLPSVSVVEVCDWGGSAGGSSGGTGGGDIDWANPVSIAAATTLTVSSMGKNHVCSGSTYTIDFNYTSLTAGMVVAFQMAPGLTDVVTIDAGSGKTIDGEQTRVMHHNETCVLKWDGSNWQKLYGKSIPMVGIYENAGGDGVSNNAITHITLGVTIEETVSLLTSNKFTAKRKGRYAVTACMAYEFIGGDKSGKEGYALIGVNTTTTFPASPARLSLTPWSYNGSNSYCHANLSSPGVPLDVGDYIALLAYQGTGSTVQTRDASGVARSNLQIVEICTW